MVICDNCKLRDFGCVAKKAVIASNSSSCNFYAPETIMEKTAEDETYTVSWPSGDKTIVQTNKGGRIISSKIV